MWWPMEIACCLGLMFRGRCSPSNGCLLLGELTASYAASIQQPVCGLLY
jgi:hypothetical protein